uniref:Uncharacterized protein n=1 Tax=Anopheles coluzzii TaxID=1518534 RepID=A0A8W7PNB5_ANOCL
MQHCQPAASAVLQRAASAPGRGIVREGFLHRAAVGLTVWRLLNSCRWLQYHRSHAYLHCFRRAGRSVLVRMVRGMVRMVMVMVEAGGRRVDRVERRLLHHEADQDLMFSVLFINKK